MTGYCKKETVDQLTIIIWETNAEMYFLDLFLKEVLLVQEENNGGGSKELVVAYTVEQMQGFVHAVLEGKTTQFKQAQRLCVKHLFILSVGYASRHNT